jgi:hypothetical protein
MPPTKRTSPSNGGSTSSYEGSPPPYDSEGGAVIDYQAVQQILAALSGLTDVIGGRANTGERTPSVDQARVILDYNVLSGLLGRAGRVAPVISARRDGDTIKFLDPLPADATQVAVTPEFGVVEVVTIDRNKREAVLQTTPQDQQLVRIELETAAGIPVALGPRLPAIVSTLE